MAKIKRFTAILLSTMMIFINVFSGSIFAYAETEIAEEPVIEQVIDEDQTEETQEEVPEEKEDEKSEEVITEEEVTEEDVDVEAEQLESDEVVEPVIEVAEEETKEEVKEVAFEQSKTVDGVKITVSAEAGVFPEGAVLRVQKLSAREEAAVEKAIDKVADEAEVAVQYNFDIAVIDKDGNEIEPKGEAKVSFETEEIADEALKAEVFHIKDNGVAEALDVEAKGEIAMVETDGFSAYSIRLVYSNFESATTVEADIAVGDWVSVNQLLVNLGFTNVTATSVQADDGGIIQVSGNALEGFYIRASAGDPGNTHGIEVSLSNGRKINITVVTHTHVWDFSVSGNTATLRCTVDHCVWNNNSYTAVLTGKTVTYNGSAHTASLSSNMPSDCTVSGISYYEGTTLLEGAPVNAGTYTAEVTVTPHGGVAKKIYATIQINKADIVVTAPTDRGVTYNGEAQLLHTYGSGQGVGKAFTMLYADGAATQKSEFSENGRVATNAGTYTIKYYVPGDRNHNDSPIQTLTCHIYRKGVRVTGITANSKVYDGTRNASINASNAQFDGKVVGDVLTVTTTSGTFDTKNVGTHKTVTFAAVLGGASASNYYVMDTSQTTAYADVTQKALTIYWNGAGDNVYTGNDIIPTAFFKRGTALAANDGLAYSSDALYLTVAQVTDEPGANQHKPSKNVGTGYVAKIVDFYGADAANYTIDPGTVKEIYNIVEEGVVIHWDEASLVKMYNGEKQLPEIESVDGIRIADIGNIYPEITVEGYKDVGIYKITVQLVAPGHEELLNDYTLDSSKEVWFEITKAPLHVSAAGWLYYGETFDKVREEHYELVDEDELQGEDTIAVLRHTGRYETDYGSKYEGIDPITDETHEYHLLPVFENAQNYEIINVDGELTVYPRPVTLIWTDTHFGEASNPDDNAEYVYDGKNHVYTAEVTDGSYYKINGIKVDQDIVVTVENNIERDANVKTGEAIYTPYAVSLDNPNYSLQYVAEDGNRTKYDVDTRSINFTIDQLPIELSWEPTEFIYDGKVQQPAETIDNLQTNDEGVMDEVFEITKEIEQTSEVIEAERKDKSIEVGNYTITAVELADHNYSLLSDPTDATSDPVVSAAFNYIIKPRTIELKWTPNATEFVYNAKVQGQSAEVINFAENEDAETIGADSELVELVKKGDWEAIDAGEYVATIEELLHEGRAANYSFEEINRGWIIKQAPLTVIAKAKTITYGDNPANAGVSYSGFKGKDDASVLSGSVKYSYNYAKWGKPGTYKIDISKSNLSAKNYKISYKAGNLKVNDKVNRIAAKAIAKGKDQASISWNKVSGAASYEVYFSLCNTKGKEHQPKKIATVKGTSYVVKNLKKNTFYKFYVIAKDSKGKQISKSLMGHFITGDVKGKETNAKSLKLNATKVSVKVGKTYKVKGTVAAVKKGKKLHTHCETLRFVSSNSAVATVDANGNIKGVGKGWCRIYVQTANGIWQTVEVTVA
jgi:hypothetical protein